ncbi:MAG: NPXTG-anchored protein [Oscillospiraceae bacterium]|nr:NPXTG-anchored protein [Oscillospiraceae bacterium]
MKKLLAILLAVACCLSCLAFVVSADAADILADAPANYTPWIDFTDWTETELAPFAVNKETEVVVPSIDENGLMTLTMTNNLGYVGYYAPGTNVAVKDDETGEITGAYPGTVLSLNEGSAFTDSTDATSGVCFWIDLSGMNGVHENGDGTMNLYFYFNDLDFNEDGTVNKKAGKEVSTSWKGTAVVPVNYVGWVTIPFADMVAEWDTPDNNGKIDMNTIDWFMIYPNNPTDGGVYKIGHVGFYGSAFLNLENYADQVPAYYTPWIDFTDWTETELAPFAVNKETEVVVPSVDKNGLMTLTMTNNLGYVGYYAPGTNVAVKDDETGETTGAYPGTTLYFNEGSALTDSTDANSGVCFFIDLSGMNGVHENGDGTMNLLFYFNDLDFNEDGTVNKKAGKEVSTSWKGTAVVPVNYVGWVKIPFADMVAEWDTPDNNGKIDLNTVDWFMVYPNNPTNGGVYKIGHVGFYGDAMFALDENVVVGTEMPEDWTLIVDGSEIENDDYNSGLFTADPETQGTIEAVDTGLKVTVPSTCTGWWFQKGATFYALDDETGDRVGNLPGFTGKLDKWYDATSDDAGLAFYIEAPAINNDNDWWVGFYLQEKEITEDGTVKLIQGKEATTTFVATLRVPANFTGWVKVPFSELVQDKWGETAQDIANEDGKFNAEVICNITYVASLYPSDVVDEAGVAQGYDFVIGDVAVWGEGTSKTVDDGNDDDKTPDDGNDDENPDTGVTGVAGVASVAAIIALAAVVCFRKKD